MKPLALLLALMIGGCADKSEPVAERPLVTTEIMETYNGTDTLRFCVKVDSLFPPQPVTRFCQKHTATYRWSDGNTFRRTDSTWVVR